MQPENVEPVEASSGSHGVLVRRSLIGLRIEWRGTSGRLCVFSGWPQMGANIKGRATSRRLLVVLLIRAPRLPLFLSQSPLGSPSFPLRST